jgi:hypothetical protein
MKKPRTLETIWKFNCKETLMRSRVYKMILKFKINIRMCVNHLVIVIIKG